MVCSPTDGHSAVIITIKTLFNRSRVEVTKPPSQGSPGPAWLKWIQRSNQRFFTWGVDRPGTRTSSTRPSPLGFVQNVMIKTSLPLSSSANPPILGLGPQSRKLLFCSHLTARDRALGRETNLRHLKYSLIETLSKFSPLLPACRIKWS